MEDISIKDIKVCKKRVIVLSSSNSVSILLYKIGYGIGCHKCLGYGPIDGKCHIEEILGKHISDSICPLHALGIINRHMSEVIMNDMDRYSLFINSYIKKINE